MPAQPPADSSESKISNALIFILISFVIIILGTIITSMQNERKATFGHPELVFRGIVQNEVGKPIRDASVSCQWSALDFSGSLISDKTDENGKFFLKIGRSGFNSYRYSIEKEGYQKFAGEKSDSEYLHVTLKPLRAVQK
jgi:uncharacterized membrane protein